MGRARLLIPICVAAGLVAVAGAFRAVTAQETDPPGATNYGGTPGELRPFGDSGEPERRFFLTPPEFRGPGRDAPPPEDVEEVRLGVMLPIGGPHEDRGRRMLNGITLAVEQANAAGGFAEGVPFTFVTRAENESWGATANAAVELATGEGVYAFIGALEDEASHVMTRVLLKVEVPMVNTTGPDPTLTEHAIPWLVRVRSDDRQTCYRLADRIFKQDGRKRVAVFRENSRYARMGIKEFVDAARRLHNPILLEVRFQAHETEWEGPIERLRRMKPDAIVMWGDADPSGRALKALRASGIDQPVYGPDRLVDPAFIDAAGKAAEGVVVSHPFDPAATGKRWKDFAKRYEARFGRTPGAVAASSYDGTRYLIEAIRKAGLNRPLIRDELFAQKTYEGVTGTIRFDSTHNNVSPGVMGQVRDGRFVFD